MSGAGGLAVGEPGRVRAFCRSWAGGGVVLLVVSLAVDLPGLWAIGPVDRDESRFAQASRQMYESGDYVVPRVQERARLNKPPLIYWLQCASIAVFGDREGQYANANIWVFRVPSVLAALASVVMTWRLGLRMFDPRAALLAGVLLAVSPMVIWDAHQARADQVLMASVVGAQGALYAVWRGAGRCRRDRGTGAADLRLAGWTGVFWGATAVGILDKGPIAPMISALTVLALSATTRSWCWILRLRPVVGLLIVSTVVGPWTLAVATRVGWGAYLSTIYNETIGRSGEPKEGHWGPPGYHLVLLVVLFWPGALLTAAGLKRAWGRAVGVVGRGDGAARLWRVSGAQREAGGGTALRLRSRFADAVGRLPVGRERSPELFLLAWIVPAWIVFELIATKLPHYTMPMFPAVALVSARMVLSVGRRPLNESQVRSMRIGVVVWALLGATILLVPLVLLVAAGPDWRIIPKLGHGGGVGLAWIVLLGASVVALGGIASRFTLRLIAEGRVLRVLAWAIGGVIVSSGALLGVVVPVAGRLSVDVAEQLRRVDPGRSRAVGGGYVPESLVFATRGRVQRLSRDDVAGWIDAHPAGIVVVPDAWCDGLDTAGKSDFDRGLHRIPDSSVSGVNFSNGYSGVVHFYEREP